MPDNGRLTAKQLSRINHPKLGGVHLACDEASASWNTLGSSSCSATAGAEGSPRRAPSAHTATSMARCSAKRSSAGTRRRRVGATTAGVTRSTSRRRRWPRSSIGTAPRSGGTTGMRSGSGGTASTTASFGAPDPGQTRRTPSCARALAGRARRSPSPRSCSGCSTAARTRGSTRTVTSAATHARRLSHFSDPPASPRTGSATPRCGGLLANTPVVQGGTSGAAKPKSKPSGGGDTCCAASTSPTHAATSTSRRPARAECPSSACASPTATSRRALRPRSHQGAPRERARVVSVLLRARRERPQQPARRRSGGGDGGRVRTRRRLGRKNDLPLAYDFENANGQSARKCAGHLVDFVRAYRGARAHYPILYTMPGFWTAIHKELSAPDRKLVGNCPLWIAHWEVRDPARWHRGAPAGGCGKTRTAARSPAYRASATRTASAARRTTSPD